MQAEFVNVQPGAKWPNITLQLENVLSPEAALDLFFLASLIESVVVSSRYRTVTRSSSKGGFMKEGSYGHCK